jgi:glutamine---fructose-6-phosphate transaminase (isomerizing)
MPMDTKQKKYTRYALPREMLETPGYIAGFDFGQAAEAEQAMRELGRVLLTGEGSSRIFPAKHFRYQSLLAGAKLGVETDGGRQCEDYDLSKFVVFGASNSGKTKEVVSLFASLRKSKHPALFSLSAFSDTPLGQLATQEYVLSCGKEQAVAATKSVVEQALFYHAILDRIAGRRRLAKKQAKLATLAEQALTLQIDPDVTKRLASAQTLHWAGRNTGVAEELTLKTNEITRKRSAYLEGTYAVHGIEEVMTKRDAVIVVDPFESEEEKFEEVLVKGVGCRVVAIASRPTRFPTIRIPKLAGADCYLQLMAGWNLLVEIACALEINMDKTERARKVGNELVVKPAVKAAKPAKRPTKRR